ncbi:MAG: helix-turn-helix domain-containing protein [Steroidobacteraceae bacterium]
MDTLLTPIQAAKILAVSTNTLACWRSTKRYPLPWVRVGNRVRYRQTDLDRFITARSQNVQPAAA